MNAAAARGDQDGERSPARPGGQRVRRAGRPVAPTTDTVWIARLFHRGIGAGTEHSLVLVNSDRFPTGTPVDISAQDAAGRMPAGWVVEVRYRAGDGRILRIDVAPSVAEPAPPLWFAEIAHATSGLPSGP